MPCMDCTNFRRTRAASPSERRAAGWCARQSRTVHPNYHCGMWRQHEVTHADVGLRPNEVAWGRDHPLNPTIRELNTLYRRIQFQPHDFELREQFAHTLGEWRRRRRDAFDPEDMP